MYILDVYFLNVKNCKRRQISLNVKKQQRYQCTVFITIG